MAYLHFISQISLLATDLTQVVGHGGQALLAFCSWKAVSVYIQSCLFTHSITYDTFWTVFITKETSLFSVVAMALDFSKRAALKSKTAMVFIIASLGFIVAFPTLASSMTGYASNTAAFFEDSRQNRILFDSYGRVLFVIHDGWRLNLTADYQVVYWKPPLTATRWHLVDTWDIFSYDKQSLSPAGTVHANDVAQCQWHLFL